MAESETPDKKAGKKRKWPKPPKQPVVFTFQPTHYRVVPPEKLAEWEENMRTLIGFPPELVRAIAAAGGTETDTFSVEFYD